MNKSVFLTTIRTLYKKSEADVAEHLNSVEGEDIDDNTVLKVLQDFDAEKVTISKERFNQGVGKGQKETAKKFEKALRDAFNVEEPLEGEELIAHITENIPQPIEGGAAFDPAKITEDQLLKVPAFINKKKEYEKKIKEKETEMATALQAEKEKQAYESVFSKVSSSALAILDAKKPIVPEDPNKALAVKEKLLVNELKNFKYMVGEDGKIIPLDAEGTPLQDANGNSLEFDALVNKITDDNFTFASQEPIRTSPGHKQVSTQATSTYTGVKPKNQDEYLELITSRDLTTEQRVAIREEFGEQYS